MEQADEQFKCSSVGSIRPPVMIRNRPGNSAGSGFELSRRVRRSRLIRGEMTGRSVGDVFLAQIVAQPAAAVR
jgi:hypothetical protein